MPDHGTPSVLPVRPVARIQAYKCPRCGHPVYTAQPHACPPKAA